MVVAGLDADMLALLLHTDRATAPTGLCGPRTLASARPWALEATTGRPVVVFTIVCKVFQVLERDLQVLTHEMFHGLVRELRASYCTVLTTCLAWILPMRRRHLCLHE